MRGIAGHGLAYHRLVGTILVGWMTTVSHCFFGIQVLCNGSHAMLRLNGFSTKSAKAP